MQNAKFAYFAGDKSLLTQKVSLLTKKIKFNKVFGMCSAYMMELCGVYEGIVN
jgi:hypothetical protein